MTVTRDAGTLNGVFASSIKERRLWHLHLAKHNPPVLAHGAMA
jgi:hypothetical protein